MISLAAAANPSIALQSQGTFPAAESVVEAPSVSTAQLNITGTIRGVSGSPVEPVRVRVYAWPPDFAESPDGFSLVLLGETEADAQGAFSVRPDYSRLWAEIASSRSQTRGPIDAIDIEVVADSSSGLASYTTTAQVTPAARTMRFGLLTAVEQNTSDPVSASRAGQALGANRASATATRLDSTGLNIEMQMIGFGQDTAASDGSVSAAAAPPMLGGCYLSRDLGSRLTHVGALGSTTTGYTGRLKYTSGATTSVTAGISASGAYGTFTASGTTSRTSTGTVSFPTYTNAGYRIMRTQFNYGIYRCMIGPNVFRWVTRVTSFDSGSSPWAATMPAANYCVRYSAGSGFTKTTSAARTLTAAVSGMYSAIGMNMSAQTGYNTSLQAAFTFPSSRQLCGTHGTPGNSPGTLVVKP